MRRLGWILGAAAVGLILFFVLRPPADRETRTSEPSVPVAPPPSLPAAGAFDDSAPAAPERLPAAADASNPTAELRSGAIRGRVVDPAGRPVADATVVFLRRDEESAFAFALDPTAPMDARLRTGEDGVFVARDLAADGAWDLVAWHADYALVSGPAAHGLARADQDLPDLRLSDGFVLAGMVSDDQKQPLAGVRVELAFDGLPAEAAEESEPFGWRLSAVSDAAGGFEFLGIGAGSWTLRARHPGYGDAWVRPLTFFEGQSLPELNVTLGPERPISGSVVTTDDAPVADAVLRLQRDPAGLGPELLARTDAAGRFEFRGAAEGIWTLSVERAGFLSPPPLRLNAGEGEGLRLELTPFGLVRGRIQGEADPAVGTAEFWLTSRGHPPYRPSGAAPMPWLQDGSFSLLPPGPGTFVLLLRSAGHAPTWSPMFQVGPQVCELGTIPLDRGARVRGRLVREDGSPVAGAIIQARGAGWSSDAATQPFGALTRDLTEVPPVSGRSGEDGSFELADLSPLTGALSFESASIATWVQPVQLSAGQDLDLGDLRVPTAGVIEVLAWNANGQPLAGGTLMMQREELGPGVTTRLLDARGSARVEGLASGDWWISVMDGGGIFGLASPRQRVWLAPGAVQRVEIRLEAQR